MKQSRFSSLFFEIAGIISFIIAFLLFDNSMTNNDPSIVALFSGLLLFALAGMFYDYNRPAVTDIIPCALGIVGILSVIIGIGGFRFEADWAFSVTIIGAFALIADTCFIRLANR